MSTPHNSANVGDIAERLLIPGDPLRAKYIAEHFLDNAVCYNKVRGMLGFTGTYKGVPVSVQGSGMGMPSISIYAHELLNVYGVKKICRIGTAGCYNPDWNVGDVVLAMSASTDSNINRRRFNADYAACADFDMLYNAYNASKELGIGVHAGNVLSSDVFYQDDPQSWKLWAEYGVYTVEMESNALYTIAAKAKAQALAIFTISDHLAKKVPDLTTAERETNLNNMIKIALDGIIK